MRTGGSEFAAPKYATTVNTCFRREKFYRPLRDDELAGPGF
mgnify:CR=1 FL=1